VPKRKPAKARARAPQPGPWSAGASRWLRYAVYAVCVLYALLLLQHLSGLARIVGFPGEVNFGEGLILADAQRLAQGQPIYADPAQPPYWFANYPPLYQWLASFAAGSFLWPRLISLAASLFSAAALGWIVWRTTRSAPGAFVAAALWVVTPFVGPWGAVARVDMTGRALESAAVLVIWMWPRRWPAFAGAVLLAAFAMVTKQPLFAGAITCVLLLWQWSPGRALAFGAAWLGLTAAAYLVLNLATGGWFWNNVFRALELEVSAPLLREWTFGYVLASWGMLAVAVLGWGTAWRDRSARVLALAVIAGVPHMLLAATEDADRNYFFDVNWGLCGLAGYAIGALHNSASWKLAVALGALGASGVLLMASVSNLYPTPQQAARARDLVARLKDVQKPILSELPGYVILAGHKPEAAPHMLKKLEERGKFDPSPIVSRISNHEYGAVVLTGIARTRWSKSLLDAVNSNYSVIANDPTAFMVDGTFGLFLLDADSRE
jgi:hypothetical protein